MRYCMARRDTWYRDASVCTTSLLSVAGAVPGGTQCISSTLTRHSCAGLSYAAACAAGPYQFQWWALSLVGARPLEKKKGAD